MNDSEWHLRWAPSWSVQVAVEGQQYLQFSLTLRLEDLRLSGRITLKMSSDLSTIILSFTTPPKLRLKTAVTVSWGSVALPLQTYIETVVQDEFQRECLFLSPCTPKHAHTLACITLTLFALSDRLGDR